MRITGFIDEIDKGFEKEIEVVEKLKMNFIELRSVNGVNVSDLTLEEVRELKKYLVDRKIKISCIASPIGKIDIETGEFEKHYEKFKHVINIAKILEVKYVRIFSFFVKKELKKHYEKEILERVALFVKEIQDTEITLIHENEKDIYGDDIESCLNLISTIDNPKLKLIFDSANFVQVGVNPLEAYEKLKDFIEYIHLKDAEYSSCENVLIGTGSGEIYELLRKLNSDNYKGFISLEPHLVNFSVLQSLELEDISKRKAEFKDGEEAFTKSLETLLQMMEKIEYKEETLC